MAYIREAFCFTDLGGLYLVVGGGGGGGYIPDFMVYKFTFLLGLIFELFVCLSVSCG